VTLSEISERQSISLSYLEQLFNRMRKHDLVKSVKGPGGGYLLAKSHEDITIKSIITAVDEKIDATQWGGHENCHDGGRCITHDLWINLNTKILDYLDSLTIADLIANQDQKPINFDVKRNDLGRGLNTA